VFISLLKLLYVLLAKVAIGYFAKIGKIKARDQFLFGLALVTLKRWGGWLLLYRVRSILSKLCF